MKNTILLLTLSFLASCGLNEIDPRTHRGVDPEFGEVVSLYVNKKGSPFYYDISINFAQIPKKDPAKRIVGVCSSWTLSAYREIVIDREYWNSSSPTAKTSLIFHELGHCDLNREHNNESKDNKPLSFMQSVAFTPEEKDLDYYFNELFGR